MPQPPADAAEEPLKIEDQIGVDPVAQRARPRCDAHHAAHAAKIASRKDHDFIDVPVACAVLRVRDRDGG